MAYEIIIKDMKDYPKLTKEEKNKIFSKTPFTLSGGDVAAIMGVNPYETNVQLYNRKIKRQRRDVSDAMLRGMDYETAVKMMFKWEYQEWFEQEGFQGQVRSLEVPYLTGVPDDILTTLKDIDFDGLEIPAGTKILHEIKSKYLTAKEAGFKTMSENLKHYLYYIDIMYEVQMQLYMWIMDLDYGLYTMCGVNAPRGIPERNTVISSSILIRDDEKIKRILESCSLFYNRLLNKKEPPLYQLPGGF